ncbi:DoxX family protein [Modestobacter lapidis]|nr:DoxX family protein [Modestobacter lapidis]
MDDAQMIDLALLLLRVVLGVVLVCHGLQKALGWLQGPGLTGAAAFMESLGHRPGLTKAKLAIACEIGSGILLLLGLATPLAAAVAAGTMLVAATSTMAKARSFWNTQGGGEYPFVLALVAGVLAFSGPGKYSLDAVVLPDLPALTPVVVIVVAVVTAIPQTMQAIEHQRRVRAQS